MVEDIKASIVLWGEKFSPQLVEEKLSITFSDKNEVGDIDPEFGDDEPADYGSASFDPPENVGFRDKILWLAEFLQGKVEVIEECGATKISLYVSYLHDGQLNDSLSKEELRAIADLGIEFIFSAYDLSEYSKEAETLD